MTASASKPPCPITEPVTLQQYAGPSWTDRPVPHQVRLGHVPAITLYPPGADERPDPDRPYGIYTWGES